MVFSGCPACVSALGYSRGGSRFGRVQPVNGLDTVHDCGRGGLLHRVLLDMGFGVVPTAIVDGAYFVTFTNGCQKGLGKAPRPYRHFSGLPLPDSRGLPPCPTQSLPQMSVALVLRSLWLKGNCLSHRQEEGVSPLSSSLVG